MTEIKYQLLDDFDWGSAILKLTAYALSISGMLGKRLPKGLEPEDLVMNAIEKLYSGERNWDPNSSPDLLRYLKSVIKSILSNEINSQDGKIVLLDDQVVACDKIVENQIEEEMYCAKLDLAISISMEGDAELCLVYKALKDELRPSEIAEEYCIDIKIVRNAQKRLHRLAINVVRELSKEYLQ